jgi:DNA polymerase III epsilon subunit family exonuclease
MPFVVVDIETTGLSKDRHGITEIAGIRSEGGRIVDEFQTLVNPEVEIKPFITHLTGITNEMVKDAPKIPEAIHRFVEFAEDSFFVAHNASFDYGFLKHNAEANGHNFKNHKICTVKLARRLFPMLASKRLAALCDYFHIVNEQEHRAMSDARATYCIFNNMRAKLRKMGVEDLVDIMRFERLSKREIFDKYGTPW